MKCHTDMLFTLLASGLCPTPGAGGGDAYTVQQKNTQLTSSSKAGSTLQRSTLLPALPNHQQPEVLQGDTWFPASLSTQHDINCVLTQQPGKLRSKDIKVGCPTAACYAEQ